MHNCIIKIYMHSSVSSFDMKKKWLWLKLDLKNTDLTDKIKNNISVNDTYFPIFKSIIWKLLRRRFYFIIIHRAISNIIFKMV